MLPKKNTRRSSSGGEEEWSFAAIAGILVDDVDVESVFKVSAVIGGLMEMTH
jgi:hypothetical protein